jgi:hypothetical protein
MTATTVNRAQQTPRAPLTFNREQLTAEIILATDQAGADGYQLQIRSDLNGIQLPQGRLPILRDHRRETAAQIGWIESVRFERLPQGLNGLVGIARFHPERSADLLDLIEAGAMYWSVSFQIQDSHSDTRSGVEVVSQYRLLEVSAVPTPLDPNSITRSISFSTMTTDNTTTTVAEPQERSAKEIKRERDILRLANSTGITDPNWVDEQVASDRSLSEIQHDAIRSMRIRLENGDCRKGEGVIGHPAQVFATPSTARSLDGILAAKMGLKGEGIDRNLANVPMHRVLCDHLSNHQESRGLDLASMPITKLVARAFSTSDFTTALTSTAERVLLNAYQEAQVGVTALATSRDLPDFRAMEMLRISQYGALSEKLEGGEYKTSTFSEEDAATLQAAEYGAIQPITRRALANDNLSIFSQMVAEMGRAAARKERSELAARLLNDFTWGTDNSDTTSGLLAMDFINGIIKGTLKLRRQTDVDGNAISFEPRLLLVAPEQEAIARQALGEYVPNNADDVLPYRTLRIEVDHYLPGGEFYLADTAYPQLVIGRIGGGPVTSQEQEFTTGNELFRVQHDFGTAVLDQRSIVKLEITSSET